MKIKKVDDKPIVIHTKKKAKIYTHEPKKASIKASNIYTVRRSLKIKRSKNATRIKAIPRYESIWQREQSLSVP